MFTYFEVFLDQAPIYDTDTLSMLRALTEGDAPLRATVQWGLETSEDS